MRTLLAVVTALVLAGGCSSPSNTQFIPIGSRCSSDGDCGTRPFNCKSAPSYPGGYCQKDCALTSDCPLDADCVAGECRRKCTATGQCRANEGYQCRAAAGAPDLVCDVPLTPGDGGA